MEGGNTQYGMQTFDQSIMKLHKAGMISFEEAMANASNPDDLDLRLKGITGASDRWADDSGGGDSGGSEPEGFAGLSDPTNRSKKELPGGFNKY